MKKNFEHSTITDRKNQLDIFEQSRDIQILLSPCYL
jgi:hypothetical protein